MPTAIGVGVGPGGAAQQGQAQAIGAGIAAIFAVVEQRDPPGGGTQGVGIGRIEDGGIRGMGPIRIDPVRIGRIRLSRIEISRIRIGRIRISRIRIGGEIHPTQDREFPFGPIALGGGAGGPGDRAAGNFAHGHRGIKGKGKGGFDQGMAGLPVDAGFDPQVGRSRIQHIVLAELGSRQPPHHPQARSPQSPFQAPG